MKRKGVQRKEKREEGNRREAVEATEREKSGGSKMKVQRELLSSFIREKHVPFSKWLKIFPDLFLGEILPRKLLLLSSPTHAHKHLIFLPYADSQCL